jgi:hypothetical protein
MLPSSELPCQVGFSFLSVPDLQPVACTPDALDHDASSANSNSVNSEKIVRGPYVPVNYICPEAYALLAAAEASAARRADDSNAGHMDIDANGNGGGSTLESSWHRMIEPERPVQSMARPKRFYRTFWKSVSARLTYRLAQSSPGSGPVELPFVITNPK